MSLEQFKEWLRMKNVSSDMIVKLNFKYDFEEKYEEGNYYLYWDGESMEWLDDWYEGQDDIIVVGYVMIEDIQIDHIF